jgi:hypothetical protein
MLKIASLALAIALAGCAAPRQERARAFQAELPQLVAACNHWRQSDVTDDGRIARGEGLEACSRLRDENSLQLADASAVSAYRSYTNTPTRAAATAGTGAGFAGAPYGAPTPILGPGGAPQ